MVILLRMTSGKDLKLRRVNADLKAKDVAEAAGVSQQQVSRWENSRVVTEDAEARYMAALTTCITKSAQSEAA